MAHVFLILQILSVITLTLLTDKNARADYTPPIKYQYNVSYGSGYSSSKQALCEGAIQATNNKEPQNASDPFVSVYACFEGEQNATSQFGRNDVIAIFRRKSGFLGSNYFIGYVIQYCDSPNTRKQGYPPNVLCSGAQPPTCIKGELVSSGYYDGGKDPNAPFANISCSNGCSVMFTGTWPHSQSNQSDGMHYYAKGSFSKDGFTCTGNTSPTGSSVVPKSVEQQAADAAAAQAAADKAAKAAADKAAADAKTAADKAAASAAAAAAETARRNADALKQISDASKAIADALNKDPNATQADKDAANSKAASDLAAANAAAADAAAKAGAAAAANKSETPEKTKDFCEVNPESIICKNSQVNAGYCNPSTGQISGFSCTSDPVFCESAKAQIQSHCFLESKDEAMSGVFTTMKTEGDSNSPAKAGNGTTINLPTALDESSPFGNGSCNPDITISVGSTSATLPFSSWCPYLEALGYLFLTMAYLSAATIVSRG